MEGKLSVVKYDWKNLSDLSEVALSSELIIRQDLNNRSNHAQLHP